MLPWRKILSLGILGPQESLAARRWDRFFDYVLLAVMFWLPLQWYLELKGVLSADYITTAYWVVWAIFTLEFAVMLLLVDDKNDYLQTNWLNLLIIVVVFPPLLAISSPYFALVRYLRIIVFIRLVMPQLYYLHRILSRNHFGTTLLVFLIVTILSGILISYIDPALGSPWEGIWWAWQTVTTVGYGDIIPNTVLGKVFAAALMLVGVGLFSLVSANLAAYFIERGARQKDKKPERQLQKQFRELNEKMNKIEEMNRRIEVQLDQIINKTVTEDEESMV